MKQPPRKKYSMNEEEHIISKCAVDSVSAEIQKFQPRSCLVLYHFYSKIHEKVDTSVKFCTSRQVPIQLKLCQHYCRDAVVIIKPSFELQLSFPIW